MFSEPRTGTGISPTADAVLPSVLYVALNFIVWVDPVAIGLVDFRMICSSTPILTILLSGLNGTKISLLDPSSNSTLRVTSSCVMFIIVNTRFNVVDSELEEANAMALRINTFVRLTSTPSLAE